MCDTECVIESGVQCAWIYKRSHCQLPNPSKSLQYIKVNQFHLFESEADEVMNWISKTYFGHSVSISLRAIFLLIIRCLSECMTHGTDEIQGIEQRQPCKCARSSLELPPIAQRPFEGGDGEQEEEGERRLCACPATIAA